MRVTVAVDVALVAVAVASCENVCCSGKASSISPGMPWYVANGLSVPKNCNAPLVWFWNDTIAASGVLPGLFSHGPPASTLCPAATIAWMTNAVESGSESPVWSFAVATHPELGKVAPSLGLFYGPQGSEIIHNLVIAVIDPEGRLVRLESGNAARNWDTADLLKTMYSRIPGAKG